MNWLKTEDGRLCLDGYPIHIELQPPGSTFRYILYDRGHRCVGCQVLDFAKLEGEQLAKELDTFA